MNVYCGGACLERPKIRISQMAASVESLGMNLIHNLLFLNAGSSGEREEQDMLKKVKGRWRLQQKEVRGSSHTRLIIEHEILNPQWRFSSSTACLNATTNKHLFNSSLECHWFI